jgi:hypothetical protein
LLRFLLLLQVTAGAGRRGEETDLGRPVARPFSQRRVNPRAASDGGAWEDAPPLFLRWQKGFPAISGFLGTVFVIF